MLWFLSWHGTSPAFYQSPCDFFSLSPFYGRINIIVYCLKTSITAWNKPQMCFFSGMRKYLGVLREVGMCYLKCFSPTAYPHLTWVCCWKQQLNVSFLRLTLAVSTPGVSSRPGPPCVSVLNWFSLPCMWQFLFIFIFSWLWSLVVSACVAHFVCRRKANKALHCTLGCECKQGSS